jgi:hypothetical protein
LPGIPGDLRVINGEQRRSAAQDIARLLSHRRHTLSLPSSPLPVIRDFAARRPLLAIVTCAPA